jgi:DNA mismatch repair protein MutL
MPSIRQLDKHVVALIAAGEVVERPMSVVKELAENAIDAGATSITIEIWRGGFELIRVRDDGTGIDPADLPLALSRHATSKLRAADDLYDIRTLGFRGEALASIAAVSRLRIITRTPLHPAGTEVSATAGLIDAPRPVASPTGTTVDVEDLFFNVPARHAFQRSSTGEARAITQLVTQLALATPGIRWRVTLDGRDALMTPGDGSLRETLIAVNGPGLSPHLLDLPEFSEPDGSVVVSGVVSSPSVHRSTRMHCTFVVNGRVVRSQTLLHAVEEAYHAILPHGRHPVAAIRLEVPPGEVDVNVHPTKLEVRLRRERLAYARIRDAVRRTLEGHSPAPTVAPTVPDWGDPDSVTTGTGRPRAGYWLAQGLSVPGDTSLPNYRIRGEPMTGDDAIGPLADLADVGVTSADPIGRAALAPSISVYSPGAIGAGGAPDDRPRPSDLSTWRPLGQVGLTYVVAEAPDGMYLIDQHSAHERVQYEALKATSPGSPGKLSQPLLVPEALELTGAQGAWLRGNVTVLDALGFTLEPFGGQPGSGGSSAWAPDTWLLRAVPWGVAARGRATDVAALIDGLIDREYGDGPIGDQARWAVACHSSVRAGDRLSLPEMHALLDQLSRCDLRQTCPHGRPTMIHLSHSQLAREFGRSGTPLSLRGGGGSQGAGRRSRVT